MVTSVFVFALLATYVVVLRAAVMVSISPSSIIVVVELLQVLLGMVVIVSNMIKSKCIPVGWGISYYLLVVVMLL